MSYNLNIKRFEEFQRKCFKAGIFWSSGAEQMIRCQKDLIEYVSVHKEFNRYVISYDEK